jgi:hypothetical protein
VFEGAKGSCSECIAENTPELQENTPETELAEIVDRGFLKKDFIVFLVEDKEDRKRFFDAVALVMKKHLKNADVQKAGFEALESTAKMMFKKGVSTGDSKIMQDVVVSAMKQHLESDEDVQEAGCRDVQMFYLAQAGCRAVFYLARNPQNREKFQAVRAAIKRYVSDSVDLFNSCNVALDLLDSVGQSYR